MRPFQFRRAIFSNLRLFNILPPGIQEKSVARRRKEFIFVSPSFCLAPSGSLIWAWREPTGRYGVLVARSEFPRTAPATQYPDREGDGWRATIGSFLSCPGRRSRACRGSKTRPRAP